MQNKVYKALAHPARRQILSMLKSGPKSAGDLAEAIDLAWPSVSRHLNLLKDADLILAERQATTIIYRANSSVLEEIVGAVMGLMNTDEAKERGPKK